MESVSQASVELGLMSGTAGRDCVQSVRAGDNEKTVQRILRHAHSHTTSDRYIETLDPFWGGGAGGESNKWPAATGSAHAKLLANQAGEMAERLKAAVC
jgi:hypothetical protein